MFNGVRYAYTHTTADPTGGLRFANYIQSTNFLNNQMQRTFGKLNNAAPLNKFVQPWMVYEHFRSANTTCI